MSTLTFLIHENFLHEFLLLRGELCHQFLLPLTNPAASGRDIQHRHTIRNTTNSIILQHNYLSQSCLCFDNHQSSSSRNRMLYFSSSSATKYHTTNCWCSPFFRALRGEAGIDTGHRFLFYKKILIKYTHAHT